MITRILALKKRISDSTKNKGFSIVELLIAIAIGAIVSGSVASLLLYSMRMYGKQTVDVQMQQEIQTASNFVIDSIMESNSFIISESTDSAGVKRTDVAALGKFEYASASSELKFSGYVFAQNNVDSTTSAGRLYMKKYQNELLPSECVNTGEIVPDKVVSNLSNGIVNNANLLATSVQVFSLIPATGSIDATANTYANPFSVELNLQFAKNSNGTDVKKELHDTIAIRNTLKPIAKSGTQEMTPVFIKAAGASDYQIYKQPVLTSKKEQLKVSTESVEMEQALGMIETKGSNSDGNFKILEIVPGYPYDYLQYSLGGPDGKCIDDENIHYGNESFNRVTADEIAAYYNYDYWGNTTSFGTTNFHPNSGADISTMVFVPETTYAGYYEYVGDKGVYSLSLSWADSKNVIQDVNATTKYASNTGVFGWVWRDPLDMDNEEQGQKIHDEIVNGTLTTDKSVLTDGNYNIGTRIYLKSHRKVKTLNNEIFKLSIMQDAIEQYADNNMLDINCGIYKFKNRWFGDTEIEGRSKNYAALKKWEQNHKVVLYVYTPEDLVTKHNNDPSFLDEMDMVVFGGFANTDYAFSEFATNMYNMVKGISTKYTSTKPYNGYGGGDISFDVAKKIYTNVVNEQTCIACNKLLDGYKTNSNIAKLYAMLYFCENTNVPLEDAQQTSYLLYKEDKQKKQKEKTGTSYWDINTNYQANVLSSVRNWSGRDYFLDKFDIVESATSGIIGGFTGSQYYHTLFTTPYKRCADYNDGIYRNQLKYNDGSNLMTYNSSGSGGLLAQLQSISKEIDRDVQKDTYGDVEIVGVSLRKDQGRHVNNKWPYVFQGLNNDPYTYSEVNPIYQIDVAKLNSPIEITDGGEIVEVDKVIYLNQYEYEYAKTNKAWIYCIINESTAEPLDTKVILNDIVIPYGYGEGNITRVKDELVSSYIPEPGHMIKGKPVTNTMECRCEMDITTDLDVNVFDKYIKVTAELYTDPSKKAKGSDYAFVVVRDLFDLD